MRRVLILILFVAQNSTALCQSYTIQKKIEVVVPQRNVYLNGGARSSVGGKSRLIIPVQLPKGTVNWYYSFSTSPGESGTENLNLMAQLSALTLAPSGITKTTLSNIKIPSGSSSIDVYLFDQTNAEAFIQKVDNNGGTLYFSRESSVFNTRQAIVAIQTNIGNQFYIGLKNPSMLDGVNVLIEVVAEVSTKVYEDIWTVTSADKIYSNCIESFLARTTAIEQLCACFKDKVLNTYSPSSYNTLTISDRNSYYTNQIKYCAEETGNNIAINNNKRIKELLELLQGQNVTKDYAELEKTLFELITLGVDNYEIYNTLGFCQLCLKKYDEAKKTLTVGLGKNPTDLFLLGNLGDYYLLTNQFDQAMEIFIEHKNKKLGDKRRFKEAVSSDLREFERLGIGNNYFDRVRKELRID